MYATEPPELVAQPWNVYPSRVGAVLDSVRVSPYHLVCEDGAPEPPFALYVTLYDGRADTVNGLYAMVLPPDGSPP